MPLSNWQQRLYKNRLNATRLLKMALPLLWQNRTELGGLMKDLRLFWSLVLIVFSLPVSFVDANENVNCEVLNRLDPAALQTVANEDQFLIEGLLTTGRLKSPEDMTDLLGAYSELRTKFGIREGAASLLAYSHVSSGRSLNVLVKNFRDASRVKSFTSLEIAHVIMTALERDLQPGDALEKYQFFRVNFRLDQDIAMRLALHAVATEAFVDDVKTQYRKLVSEGKLSPLAAVEAIEKSI